MGGVKKAKKKATKQHKQNITTTNKLQKTYIK